MSGALYIWAGDVIAPSYFCFRSITIPKLSTQQQSQLFQRTLIWWSYLYYDPLQKLVGAEGSTRRIETSESLTSLQISGAEFRYPSALEKHGSICWKLTYEDKGWTCGW